MIRLFGRIILAAWRARRNHSANFARRRLAWR